MHLLYVFLISFPLILTVSGILPDLPNLPPLSSSPTPSPFPPAISDPINPSPAASPSQAVATTSFPTTSAPPTTTTTSVIAGTQPRPSNPAIQPPATATPPTTTGDQVKCERDLSRPRPKLGKSQQRYAIAVLISAAAVGVASLLYGGVYTWMPSKRHPAWRFLSIIIARLLIVGAIKVSAALVASITKASPDDGALDASGAFLTWGSAIFTRLYNEGFIMTMTALGFMHNSNTWDDKLKDFFNKTQEASSRVNRPEPQYGAGPHLTSHAAAADLDCDDEDIPDDVKRVSVWTHIFGGRWERKLLIIATIYFVQEIAVLITNVLDLVGSFMKKSDVFFTPDDQEGQCPISADDIKELFVIILLQTLYALTHQPSLVPLLTICALRPRSRHEGVKKLVNRLRWVSCLILLVWVVSLLLLPQRGGTLEPFFIAGDISLFWFVMVAPPTYASTSFIITAVYTCLAATIGVVLICRIAQSHGMTL